MSGDPLKNIEDEKAQFDIGVIAARIYTGSRDEGLSRVDAFWLMAAWFLAMVKSNEDPDSGD